MDGKKMLVIGIVVVVVGYLLLKARGGGAGSASTGTVQELGPTSTQAQIASSQLSAASNAFDALVGAQAAEQESNNGLIATENTNATQLGIANVTAPAYEAVGMAQVQAQELASQLLAQTSQTNTATQASAQTTSGFFALIGSLFSGIFKGLFGGSTTSTIPTTSSPGLSSPGTTSIPGFSLPSPSGGSVLV